jgi:hypothetical protein
VRIDNRNVNRQGTFPKCFDKPLLYQIFRPVTRSRQHDERDSIGILARRSIMECAQAA